MFSFKEMGGGGSKGFAPLRLPRVGGGRCPVVFVYMWKSEEVYIKYQYNIYNILYIYPVSQVLRRCRRVL